MIASLYVEKKKIKKKSFGKKKYFMNLLLQLLIREIISNNAIYLIL